MLPQTALEADLKYAKIKCTQASNSCLALYSSLVVNCRWRETVGKLKNLQPTVLHFPIAEEQIAAWTCLEDAMEGIRSHYRIVLGYQDYVSRMLGEHDRQQIVAHVKDTNYYRVRICRKLELVFLQVKYPFWGSIAYHLGVALAQLPIQAREICHVANCGGLHRSTKVVERYLALPRDFRLAPTDEPFRRTNVLQPAPDFTMRHLRGSHVSIATPYRETRSWRHTCELQGIVSVVRLPQLFRPLPCLPELSVDRTARVPIWPKLLNRCTHCSRQSTTYRIMYGWMMLFLHGRFVSPPVAL